MNETQARAAAIEEFVARLRTPHPFARVVNALPGILTIVVILALSGLVGGGSAHGAIAEKTITDDTDPRPPIPRPRPRPVVAPPLEANDPTLGHRFVNAELDPAMGLDPSGGGNPNVRPQFGDGPTPFPAPKPPKPTPVSITLDGTPEGPEPHPDAANPSEPDPHPDDQVPVTFIHAMRDVYARQMTWPSLKPNGLEMVVGCDGPLGGVDRELGLQLMQLPIVARFLPAFQGFQRWYMQASLMDTPNNPRDWTRAELRSAWVSYAAGWMAENSEAIEPLRAQVANAVIAAGMHRADDLMVTPEAFEALPHTADCIPCGPGISCSCQTYDAVAMDCSGDPQSCTVIALMKQAFKARTF